jgi:hypothetical protein
MPFGLDELVLLLSAASSAASLGSAANPPESHTQIPLGGQGQQTAPFAPFQQPFGPAPDPLTDILAQLSQAPTLPQIVNQASQGAAATQQASQVDASDPNLRGPDASRAGSDKEIEPLETSETLAAIPDALKILQLLFPQQNFAQRAAPAAGGQPGRPVGIFDVNAPSIGGSNIGQLLASIPRVGR